MLVRAALCVGFMFVFAFVWGWNWVMVLSCLLWVGFVLVEVGVGWVVVGRWLIGGVLVWFGGVRARYEDG